jgi:Tfp pilus assembly protein PilO
MTLVRRILAEKRVVAFPLLLVLVINVLVYALVVYPLAQRSAGAADRAAVATAALRAAERDYAAAQALVKGRVQAQEELATFYDKVLPQDFVAARTVTYARPPALAKKANLRYEAGSFAIDQSIKEGRVGVLRTKIVLQGEYENLRRFLFDLETSPEFIIVDGVTLVQSEAGKALTFNLELSTYYRAKRNES